MVKYQASLYKVVSVETIFSWLNVVISVFEKLLLLLLAISK